MQSHTERDMVTMQRLVEPMMDFPVCLGGGRKQWPRMRLPIECSALFALKPLHHKDIGRTPVWKTCNDLDWEVGESFHVYGCEWTPDHVKIFGDGKRINQVTRAELGDQWKLDSEMMLWLDSGVFHWNGFPEKQDLPVEYEIDYLRVWQQAQSK